MKIKEMPKRNSGIVKKKKRIEALKENSFTSTILFGSSKNYRFLDN